MKCTGCNAELANDAAFCPKCGTKVGAMPTAAEQAAEKLSPKGAGQDDVEVKLWSGGYSGKAMMGTWFVALIVSVALGAGCVLLPTALPILIGAIAVIWLALLLVLAYRKLSIRYELTTQRFIHQSGILTRTSDRIEMIDVDDVTFTQGFIERMTGVGTIKISSSDRTHPILKLIGISDVKRIANTFDDTRRKERRKRGVHIESI